MPPLTGKKEAPAAKEMGVIALSTLGRSRVSKCLAGEALKDVDQPSFEEILHLSQDDAKSFLVKHGVLPRDEHAATFKRWKCNSGILAKSGFRQRWESMSFAVSNDFATQPCTPLWHSAKGGTQQDFQALLRAACCLGCKLPNDSAAHMCRRPGDSWKAACHKVEDHYDRLKLCLAWSNFVQADQQVFSADMVEADSSRFRSKRRKFVQGGQSALPTTGAPWPWWNGLRADGFAGSPTTEPAREDLVRRQRRMTANHSCHGKENHLGKRWCSRMGRSCQCHREGTPAGRQACAAPVHPNQALPCVRRTSRSRPAPG